MTYFECTECGQMGDFRVMDQSQLRQQCPVCETTTIWRTAFEADEGVSL